MTQENKELSLKDLCARLPYNPMVEYKGETYNVLGIVHGRLVLCKPFMSHTLDEHPLVQEVKPYLFPLDSMTEEQDKEFALLQTSPGQEGFLYAWNCANMMKWLIENNFDYNGLIPKGHAKDATGLNVY